MKGGDRTIEARRRNLTPELGGYGIIDMNTMNLSLKCAWLKRWKNEVNFTDYPKAMMLNNGNVNYECVGVEQAGVLGYGLFRDILEKWRLFKIEYYRRGLNRLEMTIFGNDTFYLLGESMERTVFGMRRFAMLSEEFRSVKLVVLIYFGYTVTGPYILNKRQFIHLKIIARNYEQVGSKILHVDGGCSVGLRFSNMKNKEYCHVILHLVHNPTH